MAARAAAGVGWRVRETGMNAPEASRFCVYVSKEAHTYAEGVLRVPTNSYRHSNLSFEIRLLDILRSII